MIHIIVAMAGENRVIWAKNNLPWHYKEDLQRFKRLTTGNIVLMGRKTFESIGKPLPNRINIIVSRDASFVVDGCEVYASIEEALQNAQMHDKEIFIIGGGEIYRQSLGLADVLDITLIKWDYDGDAFFPEYENGFEEIEREMFEEFDFVTYRKK